jgi:predicted enzyme related to lactoylglutathione lyase
MGERTQYTPGTFSWADLSTTDQAAAKEFYSGLFGWEADDLPVGDGAVYSMMKLDGRSAAAISAQPQQQADAGVPPMWNSYVTVESADDAAAKAEKLGASVHAPPFDVMDAGRMAVIQDPQGAFFMVWEPKDNIGAEVVNGPGALSWNELATPDPPGSASFYGDLFGWDSQQFEGSPQPYLVIMNGGNANGGIRELGDDPSPPHWLVYFGIDDIDAGLAKAEELGGKKLAGPIDIGIAKTGVVQDPQGAVFALYAGEFQD